MSDDQHVDREVVIKFALSTEEETQNASHK